MSAKQKTRHVFIRTSLILFIALVLYPSLTLAKMAEEVISGQLKKWHRITLTFDGPITNEGAEDNPFLNYRLDVIFTNGKNRYIVPGFYAADGNAGQTGENSGNKWRVHFVPDEIGQWNYSAIFAQGKNIALKSFQGNKPFASGQFTVGPTDKTSPDHRARGMLRYVKKRYLQFAETKEFFLKAGADSPENFLAFRDFDGTFDLAGLKDEGEAQGEQFIHTYQPHVKDWRKGDPTWRGDKGKGIIGALNYLASKGMNSVYFVTYNIDGGDGKDVWPWADPDERLRFDCSKLDEWEIVFSHMDKLGIMLHVVTQEEENDQRLDDGNLGTQRKLYYRELIARFSHHLALTWNLGEENTNSTAQQKAFAKYIRDLDPYDHPIALHTYPDAQDKIYTPLLGFECMEAASLQTLDAHRQTLLWTKRSAENGRPWVVCLDEIARADVGVKPDSQDPTHDVPRKEFLWANLMAGGAGAEWYFGYEYPHNDLNCEDWRSRDSMWNLTRFALEFFHKYLPFGEMSSADNLTSSKNSFCFAKPGLIYAVYLPEGQTTELKLSVGTGDFTVKWYNPRQGGKLLTGSVKTFSGSGTHAIGLPPYDHHKDWLALIRPGRRH
ncbi:MAG TPA: DUF5060 domain-containing protein [Planctomycetes bacterium]|nr:DUF5060 domain-containing protein [Planctomycetota bacterium]HIJ71253.1 DUF5060 domain-containing protein [Planctomycetota bacterium]